MCIQPNAFSFMGDHWFVTLIAILIVGHYVLRPFAVLLLSLALRITR